MKWLKLIGFLLLTKFFILLFFSATTTSAFASEEGRSIYLQGRDVDGVAIKAVINDLDSGAPLGCVNCHRESGLGTSESGKTIPPVSWRFLGRDLPLNKSERFYYIQNKRPAYDAALLHRVLTQGINSKGKVADPLMPRYDLSERQTGHLLDYLKTLFSHDDPGANDETIKIATIIDPRLPDGEKRQHRAFIEGLFGMKNAGTRHEQRRKKFSPIQRAPQYESYRKWELLIWELPEDPGLWVETLNQYYRDEPVFVVLTPLVKDHYSNIQTFCSAHKTPCLLPHNSDGSKGDYYSFVFRDHDKQRRDYIARKLRNEKNKLLYLDGEGSIDTIPDNRIDIPTVNEATLMALKNQFKEICATDYTLVLMADNSIAKKLHEMNCPEDQQLSIKLLIDASMDYQNIVDILQNYSNPNICWVTDYDKTLKRNTRKIRVDVLTRKFAIDQVKSENLAKILFAFGLLNDSIHQLAGHFSRPYLMEIIEHMLNSYPNYTYFSSVSGAPNQRAIVGPYKEYCPGKSQA